MTNQNDQVTELFQFYQKDFEIRTGLKLACMVRRRVAKGAKNTIRDKILDQAALFYNVPRKDIVSKSRVAGLIEARLMCAKLFKENGLTNNEIAARLNQDRTTITNTFLRFKEHYKNDAFKQKYFTFRKYCKEATKEDVYYERTNKENMLPNV